MSRQSNIRWRKSDTAELRRVVKNYNARVRYHRTRDPSFTGTTISVKEVKASISTRNEFKSAIKNIEAVRESSKPAKRTRAESFISSRISNRPKPISTSKEKSHPVSKEKSKTEPEVKIEQPTESKNKEWELEKPSNTQEDNYADDTIIKAQEDYHNDYYDSKDEEWARDQYIHYNFEIDYDETFDLYYESGDTYTTDQDIEIPADIRREINRRLDSINAKREERFQEHKELVSTEKGTMGRLQDFEYLPKPNRLDKLKSKDEIKDYLEKLRYWDSDQYEIDMQEQYLTNYITGLEHNGFEDWQIEHIEELIEKLGIEKFIELSYVDPRTENNYLYTKEEVDYKYQQICTAIEQGEQTLADAKSNKV